MIAQKDYARLRKGERIYPLLCILLSWKLTNYDKLQPTLFHIIEGLWLMAQLYFYYSAMNAGKSTALLQSSYNYQERGMRTVVYTAEIDDRFGAGKVSSRIGLSSPANYLTKFIIIWWDSCGTWTAGNSLRTGWWMPVLTRQQVYELSEVVDQLDIPVLCYGLRTDFRGELFIGSQYLLAWSDKLVELKTICFVAVKQAWCCVLIKQADLITKVSRW